MRRGVSKLPRTLRRVLFNMDFLSDREHLAPRILRPASVRYAAGIFGLERQDARWSLLGTVRRPTDRAWNVEMPDELFSKWNTCQMGGE